MGYNEAFLNGMRDGYKLIVYGQGNIIESVSCGRGSVFSYGYEKYKEDEVKPIYFDFERFNIDKIIDKFKTITSEFYYSFQIYDRNTFSHLYDDLKLGEFYGRKIITSSLDYGVILVKVI